jgi:hypothetical protein
MFHVANGLQTFRMNRLNLIFKRFQPCIGMIIDFYTAYVNFC